MRFLPPITNRSRLAFLLSLLSSTCLKRWIGITPFISWKRYWLEGTNQSLIIRHNANATLLEQALLNEFLDVKEVSSWTDLWRCSREESKRTFCSNNTQTFYLCSFGVTPVVNFSSSLPENIRPRKGKCSIVVTLWKRDLGAGRPSESQAILCRY